MMELLVFVAVFTVLVALAGRFGVDSRDNLRSHETELAALGFVRETSSADSARSVDGVGSESDKW
jgi:hypothetical protein